MNILGVSSIILVPTVIGGISLTHAEYILSSFAIATQCKDVAMISRNKQQCVIRLGHFNADANCFVEFCIKGLYTFLYNLSSVYKKKSLN